MWQKYGFDEPNYNVNNDLNAKYTNISNSDFFTNLNNLVANIFSDINKIITEKYNSIRFVFKTNNLTEFIVQTQHCSNIFRTTNINYRVDCTENSTFITVSFGDKSSAYIKSNITSILNFINTIAFYIEDYDIYKDGKFDKGLLPIITLHKNMFSESTWNKIIEIGKIENKDIETIHIYYIDLYYIFNKINKTDMA